MSFSSLDPLSGPFNRGIHLEKVAIEMKDGGELILGARGVALPTKLDVTKERIVSDLRIARELRHTYQVDMSFQKKTEAVYIEEEVMPDPNWRSKVDSQTEDEGMFYCEEDLEKVMLELSDGTKRVFGGEGFLLPCHAEVMVKRHRYKGWPNHRPGWKEWRTYHIDMTFHANKLALT